jgi:hypothetical protein
MVSDNISDGSLIAFFTILFIPFLIFIFAIYAYMAVCLMKMAKKTNTENAWFAWIPILNIILMVQIAKKPGWWFILFFIPIVNLVISILIWMEIAKALGKPEWLGILMIVPIANFIVPGYLAFSSNGTTPSQPAPPVQPAV